MGNDKTNIHILLIIIRERRIFLYFFLSFLPSFLFPSFLPSFLLPFPSFFPFPSFSFPFLFLSLLYPPSFFLFHFQYRFFNCNLFIHLDKMKGKKKQRCEEKKNNDVNLF